MKIDTDTTYVRCTLRLLLCDQFVIAILQIEVMKVTVEIDQTSRDHYIHKIILEKKSLCFAALPQLKEGKGNHLVLAEKGRMLVVSADADDELIGYLERMRLS